jgi:hypothetical protein
MPDKYIGDLRGTLRSDFHIEPAALSGAPVSGTYEIGDLHTDSIGIIWRCTVAGTPGTWEKLSPFTQSEKNNLELELSQILSTLVCHVVYTYTGQKLTLLEIFTDATLVTKLFSKTLTYTGNNLTQIVLTRISDSSTLTVNYTYSGATLTSSTKSQS